MKLYRKSRGFTPLEILKAKRRVRIQSLTGFTLVELMLVVIIIGILVAMVVPRLAGRTEQARVGAARADISLNIGSALDLFELDNGNYPEKVEDLFIKPADAPNWRGPYIKKRPKDNKPLDPWGNPYQYRSESQHDMDYDLYSFGKNGVEGGGDDVTNWSDGLEED
ncbi:MAG: type II secretion system major pseudopilin GspG [Candidatus Omnitrophota bacterium]